MLTFTLDGTGLWRRGGRSVRLAVADIVPPDESATVTAVLARCWCTPGAAACDRRCCRPRTCPQLADTPDCPHLVCSPSSSHALVHRPATPAARWLAVPGQPVISRSRCDPWLTWYETTPTSAPLIVWAVRRPHGWDVFIVGWVNPLIARK